jgi:hypothetical protein
VYCREYEEGCLTGYALLTHREYWVVELTLQKVEERLAQTAKLAHSPTLLLKASRYQCPIQSNILQLLILCQWSEYP